MIDRYNPILMLSAYFLSLLVGLKDEWKKDKKGQRKSINESKNGRDSNHYPSLESAMGKTMLAALKDRKIDQSLFIFHIIISATGFHETTTTRIIATPAM